MLNTKVNTSGGTMLCTVPWCFINSCLLAHSSGTGQDFGLVVQLGRSAGDLGLCLEEEGPRRCLWEGALVHGLCILLFLEF